MAEIYNDKSDTLLSGTSGKDTIYNGGYWNDSGHDGGLNVTINGGKGDDSILSWGDNSYIDGGDDNDYIFNGGSNVTINAGKGDDSIQNNSENNVIINVGDGNDDILNWSSEVTISGGAGNDSIWNHGMSSIIDGGKGNDYSYNSGDFVTFKCASGDGSDTIEGFNSTSTLLIGNGADTYSTLDSGRDIVVNVGKNTVTLKDVYLNINTININGNVFALENKPVTFGDSDDFIEIIRDGISVDGGAGNDYIKNYGDSVSIDGNAGNDHIGNYGDNSTIDGGNGNDYIHNYGISYDQEKDDYVYYSNVKMSGGDGSDTIVNSGMSSIIDAGKGDDSIKNYGDMVTIDAGAGDDEIINVNWQYNDDEDDYGDNSGYFVSINSGEGNDSIYNEGFCARINAGTGNDTIKDYAASVFIDGGEGNDYIYHDIGWSNRLDGGAGNDTIENWGAESDIDGGEGNDRIFNGGWDTYIYGGEGNDSIYDYSGYYVSISGGEGNDLISLSSDSKKNLITYSAGDGNDSIVGFNSTSTLSIGGGSYSSEKSGSDIIVTVGDEEITLRGAARLSTVHIDGEEITWRINGTTATYGTPSNAIITISGVKSLGGLSIKENVVTVAKSALNQSNVTISEGYTLKLAENAPIPITTAVGWTFSGNVATYKNESTSAGYELVDNQIVYTPAGGGETLITVNGVKSADGLSLNGNVVTVAATALNQANVTITDGYKLALGEDVPPLTIANANWIINDSLATYKNTPPIETYRLSNNNQIIYTAAGDDDILVELGGISSEPTFDESESIIRLAENNIEENISIVSNSYGYKFEIGSGSYSQGTKFIGSDDRDTITNNGEYLAIETGKGNDSIVTNSKNVSISGGKGNDKIISNGDGGNTFIYTSGDGKDNVVGFKATDTIKIDAAQISANVKGNDVIFNIDNGSITLKEVATLNAAISLVDSLNNPLDISNNFYSTDGVISDDKIILSTTFDSLYTANEFEIVDSSQLTKGISIDGGAKGISLIGGAGKDTLISGEKDFELTGGKGKDVFVYNGKNGIITDYDKKDKISLASAYKDFAINDNDLILNFGEGNSLTIAGGVGREITFTDKKVNRYETVGIFDGKGKSITLASVTESFNAKSYSKLVTIDGSAANEVEIIGNKKANVIIAGALYSTLNGGKGKDTLIGGDGADIFVYEVRSGNKLIRNYGEEDLISLSGGATISDVKTKGDDLELKVGSIKITIEGDAGKSFTFIEDNVEKIYTADGLITDGEYALLTNSFNGSAEALAGYSIVNAGLLKKSVNLIGNDNTNLWGGKGNDTLTAGTSGSELWGNKGNDVLIGGKGNDAFIFCTGEGNDTIQGYSFDDGDLLQIYDKHGNESTFNKAVFNGDTLTLSIKGGGKIILNGVSAGDSFNINNTIHTINGKKLS